MIVPPLSKFTLVTVSPTYEVPDWGIPNIEQHRQAIVGALRNHGAEPEDGSRYATVAGLRQWHRQWTGESQAWMLYWIGHGCYSDKAGYTATLSDATATTITSAALTAKRLKNLIDRRLRACEQNGIRDEAWTLIILDTCRSQQGAKEVWEQLGKSRRTFPHNVGVIGTSCEDGYAFAGWFPRLLVQSLQGFTRNDENGIRIDELIRRLQDGSRGEYLDPGSHIHHSFRRTACLEHDQRRYAAVPAGVSDVAELEQVLAETEPTWRNHYLAKARGADATQPWHFCGRWQARAALCRWLAEEPHGLHVVTGPAGTGKSALLGMLLASSYPPLVEALKRVSAFIADAVRPPEDVFNAVLHLSGRTMDEVVDNLGDEFCIPTEERSLLAEAIGRRADAENRVTILTDALDESRDPYGIAALLREIASQPHTRVVVGTRRSLGDAPGRPADDSSLLRALGSEAGVEVTTLETETGALFQYAQSRLLAGLPESLLERQKMVSEIANRISATGHPFLFARLAVQEVLQNPRWHRPGDELDELLGRGHEGLFELGVNRLKEDLPATEALLHSLAYAHGNGLPRTGGIWAAAASAIYKGRVSDVDVEQALAVAGLYIVQDSEFGNTTYRLSHRIFSEWYKKNDLNGVDGDPANAWSE